jgi:hypothetical protein
MGTTIPTKIDKASVTLKIQKRPFLYSLCISLLLYASIYLSEFVFAIKLPLPQCDANSSTSAEHLDGLPPYA